MKAARAVTLVTIALATTGCLNTGSDGGGLSDAERAAVSKATSSAVDLLEKSTPAGYSAEAVASGHNGSGDAGKEVSGKVPGKGLLQVACAGTGMVTVTIPRLDVSRTVNCGDEPDSFPFRKQVVALIVGRVDSTGAYAWRVLPAS